MKTSQLVFTAYATPVLPTGASTGLPSNTTRLAGLALEKIAGGLLLTATGGVCVSLRLRMTLSSGTALISICGRAALIFACIAEACWVSSVGKCDESNFGSDKCTMPEAASVVVASETSMVPSTGCLAPAGVIARAARAVSVFWSGQAMACGW